MPKIYLPFFPQTYFHPKTFPFLNPSPDLYFYVNLKYNLYLSKVLSITVPPYRTGDFLQSAVVQIMLKQKNPECIFIIRKYFH